MPPPFNGIVSDIRGRLPHYGDDWLQGLRSKKAPAATLYIFFTNIFPAITFAFFLAERTNNTLGVVETVLSMGIGGCVFALFAGQPLVIVGVTGPVAIFCATLYDLSLRFELHFLAWLFWTCFWAGLMHLCLAIFNACEIFIRYATMFSGEVFGFLIGFIYLFEGIVGFVSLFARDSGIAVDAALLSLVLGLGHLACATSTSGARQWTVLPKAVRSLVADYGPSLSLMIFTAFRFLPRFVDLALPSLVVPATFRPTSPRPWIDTEAIASMPLWAIFAAILPAAVLTALLFFDHNISSLLSQRPEFNLKKPSSYNWDFAVLGLSIIVTGLLGLPPNYGLIPQAPLHVRSLAKIKERIVGGMKQEVWIRVCETRVSALGQSLLCFLLLSDPFLRALSYIPKGVLAGLFLYLGFSGLQGLTITSRLQYLLMDRGSQKAVTAPWAQELRQRTLLGFTALQLVIVAAIFLITLTEGGIIFPVLIILLIPIRLYLLPRVFAQRTIELLDPRESGDSGNSSSSSSNSSSGSDLKVKERAPSGGISEEQLTLQVQVQVREEPAAAVAPTAVRKRRSKSLPPIALSRR
jgi:hypothetical protein